MKITTYKTICESRNRFEAAHNIRALACHYAAGEGVKNPINYIREAEKQAQILEQDHQEYNLIEPSGEILLTYSWRLLLKKWGYT